VPIPAEILVLLGGVGLFLYGMQALTTQLRVLASDSARATIGRLAARRVSGLMAGAGVTALIQSSSATTVMVLGLVGAGILSFAQSLPVILGANIGTTFTGWAVMVLGVKVDLGLVAYPALFVSALGVLFTRGAWARGFSVVVGLCLILLGIGLMKEGMAVFDGLLTPQNLPADSLGGRLQLLALGVVVTIVTQSSSAGVAAVIVLLSAGHVSFAQGAALVIGMTVGTTFTGVLAAIGGNRAMRRTALAHFLFNLTQGLVALALLDVLLRVVQAGFAVTDAALALVMFHTVFTVTGALLFLPFTGIMAAGLMRLFPDTPEPAEKLLDPRYLSDAAAALDVAQGALQGRMATLFAGLGDALSPSDAPPPTRDAAMDSDAIATFLSRVTLPEADAARLERYTALVSLIDHLRRLEFRAAQAPRLAAARREPGLRRAALAFGALSRGIARTLEASDHDDPQARAQNLQRLHAHAVRAQARLLRHEGRIRHKVLSRRDVPGRIFAVTDAMRWLRRINDHAEGALRHLIEARSAQPAQDPPPPADPA
jgi:phosphate:Na+ symporter